MVVLRDVVTNRSIWVGEGTPGLSSSGVGPVNVRFEK